MTSVYLYVPFIGILIMEKKKSLSIALVVAGIITATFVGTAMLSNIEAVNGYDTSNLKVIEIAGDENTAKVLELLNKEDAAKAGNLIQASVETVDENTVFVISTQELKNNRGNVDFEERIQKILKKEGVVLAAGEDTDLLRDIVKQLPEDSPEIERRVNTPVMGYKFIEVPDEENPGQTRFIVEQMHLGPPGGQLAEDGSDAEELVKWITTRNMEG